LHSGFLSPLFCDHFAPALPPRRETAAQHPTPGCPSPPQRRCAAGDTGRGDPAFAPPQAALFSFGAMPNKGAASSLNDSLDRKGVEAVSKPNAGVLSITVALNTEPLAVANGRCYSSWNLSFVCRIPRKAKALYWLKLSAGIHWLPPTAPHWVQCRDLFFSFQKRLG